MDKSAFEYIVDFAHAMNGICQKGDPQMADEIIEYMRQFKIAVGTIEFSRSDDGKRIRSAAKTYLMSNLAQLPDEKLHVGNAVEIMETAFSNNGLFAGEQFPWVMPSKGQVTYLAACFYMVVNNPILSHDSLNHYFELVSSIGFAGGQESRSLAAQLGEIEKVRPGRSKIDVLDNLIREPHMNPAFDNLSALAMCNHGGLKRCLQLGINLDELLFRALDNLSKSPTGHVSLPTLHDFCTEMNDHLFSSLVIGRKIHEENKGKLLGLALNLSKSKPGYVERLIEKAGSIRDISLTASQVISYAILSKKNDLQVREKLTTSSFPQNEIKEAIKRLDARVQYQVITRLELNQLYSSRELNRITGKRLELDLGM